MRWRPFTFPGRKRNRYRYATPPWPSRKTTVIVLVVMVVVVFRYALVSKVTSSLPPVTSRQVVKSARDFRGPSYSYPDVYELWQAYRRQFQIQEYRVERGDNLSTIFKSMGIPSGCAVSWRKDCSDFCRLSRLRPGDRLTFYRIKETGQVVRIIYRTVDDSVFCFSRDEKGWRCTERTPPTITLTRVAKGTITDNLYLSCVRSGLPPGLVMQLADLFAFDIDFNTDLQPGDTFSVYFQQKVREGKVVRSGPILAARMKVGGELFQAFSFILSDGRRDYFDEKGCSLRKMFLKAPLKYRRISSTFTYRRFHPILKIFRPHLGIDYAAPMGTPVNALGDGKVIFKGWNGGFGRFIAIRHNRTYKTTYGHLSRFAPGLHVGSRVKQGEVIGYVGRSGLATGPHLDFRFYKNGRPINFLKTRFPHARSVPKSQMAAFQKQCALYIARLEGNLLVGDLSVTSQGHHRVH